MFKQKRDKFAATVTLEKPHQKKPFVQVEGKLTEEQLEAIAAGGSFIGGCHPPHCSLNHNETMVSRAQLNCRSSPSIQPKTS